MLRSPAPRRTGTGIAALAAIVCVITLSGSALAANPHPTITNVSPSFGDSSGGTSVTISGTNFNDPVVVKFGVNTASCGTVTNGSPDTVVCTTPPSAVLGPVTVQLRNPGGHGNSRVANDPGGFTYICAACTVSPVGFTIDGPIAFLTQPNGILEPGESAAFAPAWFNDSASVTISNPNFTGALSLFGGPQNGSSEPTYTISDGAGTYPTLAPTTSATCSDCYTLTLGSITGSRPSVHMDATVTETPTITSVQDTADATVWTIHIGNSFVDETNDDVFYPFVENLLHNGLTQGCATTPGGFCPGGNVTRLEMSIFLARAIAGSDAAVPATGTGYDCSVGGSSNFGDIAPDSLFCKYPNYIFAQGVTQGCGGGNFCPTSNASRQEMAAFVARSILAPGGEALVPVSYGPDPTTTRSYDCTADTGTPPGPNSGFPDVALGSTFCSDIGYVWALGIVDGFPDGTFGSLLDVTRGQMAKFLVNGFNLKLYVATP